MVMMETNTETPLKTMLRDTVIPTLERIIRKQEDHLVWLFQRKMYFLSNPWWFIFVNTKRTREKLDMYIDKTVSELNTYREKLEEFERYLD